MLTHTRTQEGDRAAKPPEFSGPAVVMQGELRHRIGTKSLFS